jgi:hypothetical protein
MLLKARSALISMGFSPVGITHASAQYVLVPTQLIAIVRRSSMIGRGALTMIKPSLNFNSGKSQKSYMDGFHRNVTVS